MRRWIWGFGCFSLLAGCGNGLVGADYPGEPLVTLSGEVLHDTPIGIEVDNPLVGLFWREKGGTFHSEQTGRLDTRFPARYFMDLFVPPDEDVIQPVAGDPDATGAIGVLLLYNDENGNNQLDEDSDPILGAGTHMIGWYQTISENFRFEALKFIDNTPPCNSGAGDDETLPPNTIHVDLEVGEACDILPDLDCRRETKDWPVVCL